MHGKAVERIILYEFHHNRGRKLGENGDGLLVLTADTAELQKFILKREQTEGAFGQGGIMKRWKN